MKGHVFFADLRTDTKENLRQKVERLLQCIEISKAINKDELVAVKLHFGEKGNTAFIRPIFIGYIVDTIKKSGGKPFLTDANTLYRGDRGEAVSHIILATQHGFNFSTLGIPVIIADGLRGNDARKVKINGRHFCEVSLGSTIVQADVLVSAAHFKGHELTGFGGTLKNLGMGCASRQGKLQQHSNVAPKVKRKECTGCKRCIAWCPANAIRLIEKKATIDLKKCIGCAECIMLCPAGAIKINWNETVEVFQEKMVEHALGVLKDKKGKSVFLNFLTDISPACDCYGHADRPIVADIGIVASLDPVAIDQASVDLVNSERGLENSALTTNLEKGGDKFKGLYPKVDWEIQLEYASQLGMGTREYELVLV